MIKVTSLNKYYNKGKTNEIHVIDNVNLELPDKGFVIILGKSGSGKTTLLNVLGGLDDANGSILYDEKEFTSYKMKDIDNYRRHNIGYVFQNYLILPEETVFQNIDTSLKLYGIQDKEERRIRSEASLKAVGMSKYRRKYANALSGGQKQRIGIARALAKLPRIIIADEPTGNLDSENSVEIMRILKDISKKYLVIMVTHNDALAWSFGDRIINYQDGHIIQDTINTPEQRAKMKLGRPKSEELTLYLSDYEKSVSNNAGVCSEIYRSKEANTTLNIKLIERDGKRYLFIDDPNVIVNDKAINIVEERPTMSHEEQLGSSTFDSSKFKDVPIRHVSFWSLFKSSFFGFFHEKRVKTGAFKVLSSILGVGLAVVAIMSYFTFFTNEYSTFENAVDTSSLSIAQAQKGATMRSLSIDEYFGAYEHGVKGLVTSIDINASTFGLTNLAGGSDSYASMNVFVPSVNGNIPRVSYGKECDDEYQVCVSTGAINFAMPEFIARGNSYNSLIGKKLYSSNGRFLFSNNKNVTPTIVGIVNEAKPFVYLSPYSEISLYDAIVHPVIDKVAILNEVTFKSRVEALYDTPASITPDTDKINVIASSRAQKYFSEKLADDVDLFNVVGTIESDEVYAIFNDDVDFELFKVLAGAKAFEVCEYKTIPSDLKVEYLTENIKGPNKFIVSKNNLGSVVDGEIIGTYESSDHNIGEIYTNFETAIYQNYNYIRNVSGAFGEVCEKYKNKYKLAVYSSDFKETINHISNLSLNYEVKETFKALSEMNVASLANGAKIIPLAFSGGILLLMFLIVLFATRSNMIRHIYSISVFRSLGASRNDVHRMFIAKDLVSFLMTMFLAILLTFIVAWIVIGAIGLYNVPFFVFLITIVVAYGFSLLGTMIPLWSLLSKTPYQISTKYDI